MATFQYWNWEEVDINWGLLDLNWEEVGILIDDVLPAVGFGPVVVGGKPEKRWYDLKPLNELPEEKKRKIIRIVCKIEGKVFEETKYISTKRIKITAEHIDIIVDKILNNIKVDVQNIH